MAKSTSIFWVISLFLLFSGCSPWPRGESLEDPRTKGEKEFDPLGFRQDRTIVTEGEYSITKEDSIRLEQMKTEWEDVQEMGGPVSQKVFRVQFYATKYPDEAQQVADFVESELSQKTYIDFKVPYYWIRAGDCETKEEANSLLAKIKGLGYRESWVVEIKIKQD
jgi:hypothetical protein